MDNLTAKNKSDLISDCIDAKDYISKRHIDVRKMYDYLAKQSLNAETSNDINYLKVAKITLDFLVKGINII